MGDSTIKKVESTHSPKGPMGVTYLASGRSVAMRLWDALPGERVYPETVRDYETVGFVQRGEAELHLEGQLVMLRTGDSWVVPKGAKHRYRIIQQFTAIEATSPPAQVRGRDAS